MRIHSTNFILFLLPVLLYGQHPTEIDFIWKSAESDSLRFEKAVMLVPIKFEQDTTTYFLQFDTGATKSYLYSNRLKNNDFREGPISTSIGEIHFIKTESIKDTDHKNASVGTLGADFVKNRIVQINYRTQKITLDAPYDLNEYSVLPMSLMNGRPVIRVNINGLEQKLLYDTGSSLFGLWTTEKNWNRLRDKDSPTTSFPISSWGKINEGFFSGVDESVSLTIGDPDKVEELKVWYVANKKFKRFFRRNDLFGIIGNQAFLDDEILLDFKENLFGVKREGITD